MVFVLLTQVPPAQAGFTDIEISGTVRDRIGTPLQGVRISDGQDWVYTNSSGSYSISEPATSSITLTASKTGLKTDAFHGMAMPGTVANFELFYEVAGTLSNSLFSTAANSRQATLSLTSWAPQPSAPPGVYGASCLWVTNTLTGARTAATLGQINPNGSSSWTYSLDLDQGSGEGNWNLLFLVEECTGGTVLALQKGAAFRIDNTPPVIDPHTIVPGDHSNAMFAMQRLLAKIVDAGPSGVDPATISFVLVDETNQSNFVTTTVSANAVTYDASSTWAKTAPQVLADGHRYRVASVSAADRAGNVGSASQSNIEGSGFLAISTQASASRAFIESATCSLGPSDLPTMKIATCTDVPVFFAETQIALSGTLHEGLGYVNHTTPLNTAFMSNPDLPGVSWSVDGNCVSGCAPLTQSMFFPVEQVTATSQTLKVPKAHSIRSLRVKVPSVWNAATISMTPVTTTVSDAACPDVSTGPLDCQPDPVQIDRSIASHSASPGETNNPPSKNLVWLQKSNLAPTPGRRSDDAIAAHAASGNMVLFGGSPEGSNLANGDTWTFGDSWTQKCTSCGPIPRNGHMMAYDEIREKAVLFGGVAYGPLRFLNETWTWDGSAWTQRSTFQTPPARWGGAMAYDRERQQVVLFGGFGDGGQLNDTWVWDGTFWTLKNPANRPTVRDSAGMAYDASSKKVVLFGGLGCGGRCGDTWTWDGNNWTRVFPNNSPAPRYGHAATTIGGDVVVFGGCASTGSAGLCALTNDVYMWNSLTLNWALKIPAAAAGSPAPRRYMAMNEYPTSGGALLHGGQGDGTPSKLDDTWILSANGSSGIDNLVYRGGGVIKSPKVFVTYWGFRNQDPDGAKTYLKNFFTALGGTSYLSETTQYYENAGTGFVNNITNPANILKGEWSDEATTPWPGSVFSAPCPWGSCTNHSSEGEFQGQIADEARRAKDHFGQHDSNAVYVVVLPPWGADGVYDDFAADPNATRPDAITCGYQTWTGFDGGRVPYIALPYMTRLRLGCGQNQPGTGSQGAKDAFGVTASHEYVGAITNPSPPGAQWGFFWYQSSPGGWLDSQGRHSPDKCYGHNAIVTLAGAARFAVFSHWSNRMRLGQGDCVDLTNDPPDNLAWYLRNSNSTGSADVVAAYATVGDFPLMCDWDGNGTVTLGVYRASTSWFYLRNSNTPGVAEISFPFGNPGDTPVCGNWDAVGGDSVGVVHNGTWYLNNQNDSSSSEYAFNYGLATDTPIVANWDNVGGDSVGVYRSGGLWFLNDQLDGSAAEYQFNYGNSSGDKPLAGNWDGTGGGSVGVYRGSTGGFYLNNQNDSSAAEFSFQYGSADEPTFTGDWDGNGTDTPGLVRGL